MSLNLPASPLTHWRLKIVKFVISFANPTVNHTWNQIANIYTRTHVLTSQLPFEMILFINQWEMRIIENWPNISHWTDVSIFLCIFMPTFILFDETIIWYLKTQGCKIIANINCLCLCCWILNGYAKRLIVKMCR